MAAGRYRVAVFLRPIPIGSMHGMFTYIWLICMINVGKYTIHRSYWICNLFEVLFGAFNSSYWEFGGLLSWVRWWRQFWFSHLPIKTVPLKVWGPSFLVMTHAFVSPLNLAPIFFNSSLKWKVGPVEIVSAKRCFLFVFFHFFGWQEEARPIKTPERINDFVIDWLEGCGYLKYWNTGPFRWELPRGRWKFSFNERFFM